MHEGSEASDRPLVSVIVPVYNSERFLREALDSALAQTYRPIEVVAVNDGSTDGSARILEDYGDRITVVHQPNAGRAAELARGARLAPGCYYRGLAGNGEVRVHGRR